MNHNIHAANLQANAARDAARQQAKATEWAARQQIDHDLRIQEAKDARLKECLEAFAHLDESSLFNKSDKDLAHFQSSHPPESPQYALALNEWNRRLVTRQVRATQHAAWIGLAGVIIGAFLGWFLSSYNPPNSPQHNQNPTGQETSQQHQRPNPDQVPPKPASQPLPK